MLKSMLNWIGLGWPYPTLPAVEPPRPYPAKLFVMDTQRQLIKGAPFKLEPAYKLAETAELLKSECPPETRWEYIGGGSWEQGRWSSPGGSVVLYTIQPVVPSYV